MVKLRNQTTACRTLAHKKKLPMREWWAGNCIEKGEVQNLPERNSFKELCEKANINPWVGVYRAVTAKLKRALERIVTTLFPQQNKCTSPTESEHTLKDIPNITEEGLAFAWEKLRTKQAPRLDRISNVALKVALKARLEWLISIFNSCLEKGIFKTQAKKQILVLLPKSGKPPDEPPSYGSICSPDSWGPLYSTRCSRL